MKSDWLIRGKQKGRQSSRTGRQQQILGRGVRALSPAAPAAAAEAEAAHLCDINDGS